MESSMSFSHGRLMSISKEWMTVTTGSGSKTEMVSSTILISTLTDTKILRSLTSENNMEFEMSPDEKIEHYYGEVCILLEEMGFVPEEVLVTDDSMLWDFYPEDDIHWEKFKEQLEWRYNIKVSRKDFIWKVAENMKYAE